MVHTWFLPAPADLRIHGLSFTLPLGSAVMDVLALLLNKSILCLIPGGSFSFLQMAASSPTP